ncbi:MAG: hypothetical protein R3282_09325 [Rhodothermales bacterium]|nr:hypothetical protein [Rhodothermales bacterium]
MPLELGPGQTAGFGQKQPFFGMIAKDRWSIRIQSFAQFFTTYHLVGMIAKMQNGEIARICGDKRQ